MDNNEVYSLFEDIKNGLKGISSKLDGKFTHICPLPSTLK